MSRTAAHLPPREAWMSRVDGDRRPGGDLGTNIAPCYLRSMKAAQIHEYGAARVLRVEEVDEPWVGPHDVLIEVHAAAVNPVDWKIRSGAQRAIIRYELPHVLGLDASGVVVRVGSKVDKFFVGDEVYCSPSHKRSGTYAEYVAVDQSAVALKPASIDYQAAASLPLVGLTAWEALVTKARLGRGQRVLIQAGSGGVGTFAIQLAKHLGAEVATTCSTRNTGLVKELGADHVIDYSKENFDEVLSGYDVVLDTLGGKQRRRALSVLRRGGRLVTLVSGIPEAAKRFGPTLAIVVVALKMLGFMIESLLLHGVRTSWIVRPSDGAVLTKIAALVEEGKVRPVIDRMFALEEIVAAHEYSESGRARGKIVIDVKGSGWGGV